MATVELFKGDDRVIVDIGSEPEKVWRGKGYLPKGEKVVEVSEVVDVVETPEVAVAAVEDTSTEETAEYSSDSEDIDSLITALATSDESASYEEDKPRRGRPRKNP